MRELALELRRLEVEEKRLELERARDLDPDERKHRREEIWSLKLDNAAKKRDGKWWRSGVLWVRAGLLVGWIAALVPVSIAVSQHFQELSEAREERLMAAIQETQDRVDQGSPMAALELLQYPKGPAYLVTAVQGVMSGADEVARTRAALTALRNGSVELTEGHRAHLRRQRDLGIEHLADVAADLDAGLQVERSSFLEHCEVNSEIRQLLGEDGELWEETRQTIETACDYVRTQEEE